MNLQAIALEEAETEIRLTVKNEYLRGRDKYDLDRLISRIINKHLKSVKIPDLRNAAVLSLVAFYQEQYNEMRRISGRERLVMLALLKLTDKNNNIAADLSEGRARKILTDYDGATVNINGQALNMYAKKYFDKFVKPTYEKMIEQYPKDPGDITGRNSLRNRAEMEVRYNDHLESIESLKKSGVKLVICSSHSDCSDRCAPWQGRVFSLDGTRGTTPDGRKYVPLEEATDIFYTTKAGRRYKNGLLGFNCRHYLVPYKDGLYFPKPNAEEEKKQYKITQEQRRLEREVRKWRTEAVMYKDSYPEYAKIAKNSAIEANREYIKYSQLNGRAYYPSRTQIL